MHIARTTRDAETANGVWSRLVRDSFGGAVRAAIGGDLQRTRFPLASPAVDGRGQASGRRILVARRQPSGVSERARTGQPVLSDLYARSHERRHETNLAG